MAGLHKHYLVFLSAAALALGCTVSNRCVPCECCLQIKEGFSHPEKNSSSCCQKQIPVHKTSSCGFSEGEICPCALRTSPTIPVSLSRNLSAGDSKTNGAAAGLAPETLHQLFDVLPEQTIHGLASVWTAPALSFLCRLNC